MSNNDKKTQNELTEKEVAEMLRITVRTLQIWRSQGKAPKHYRFGYKGVRYLLEDVLKWKENLKFNQCGGDL